VVHIRISPCAPQTRCAIVSPFLRLAPPRLTSRRAAAITRDSTSRLVHTTDILSPRDRPFVGVKNQPTRNRFMAPSSRGNRARPAAKTQRETIHKRPGAKTMIGNESTYGSHDDQDWTSDFRGEAAVATQAATQTAAVDRWVDEQMFEEDVRAVLMMMRPNRRERLQGWHEYRTGGKHFRATISWDDEFATAGQPDRLPAGNEIATVPNLADVLEAILIGSIRSDAELTAEEETAAYRDVLRELAHRVDQFADRYA
jgi:hypothetical protein